MSITKTRRTKKMEMRMKRTRRSPKKRDGELGDGTEDEMLRDKHIPTHISLLRAVQFGKEYMITSNWRMAKAARTFAITVQLPTTYEDNQCTPDNWISRSAELTRLTAEPHWTQSCLCLAYLIGVSSPLKSFSLFEAMEQSRERKGVWRAGV